MPFVDELGLDAAGVQIQSGAGTTLIFRRVRAAAAVGTGVWPGRLVDDRRATDF